MLLLYYTNLICRNNYWKFVTQVRRISSISGHYRLVVEFTNVIRRKAASSLLALNQHQGIDHQGKQAQGQNVDRQGQRLNERADQGVHHNLPSVRLTCAWLWTARYAHQPWQSEQAQVNRAIKSQSDLVCQLLCGFQFT